MLPPVSGMMSVCQALPFSSRESHLSIRLSGPKTRKVERGESTEAKVRLVHRWETVFTLTGDLFNGRLTVLAGLRLFLLLVGVPTAVGVL